MSKPAETPTPRPPTFYDRESRQWIDLVSSGDTTDENADRGPQGAAESLGALLLSSLQLPHLVVLAGSGTSLGEAGGPSMKDLWKRCVTHNGQVSSSAESTIETIGYDRITDGEDIEKLLSRCDAYQHLTPADGVAAFLRASKASILDECSKFLQGLEPQQLDAHRTFLRRMSRRRVREPRLKIFTTNYDLCFETSAGSQGLVAIDGFSFGEPRCFDPRFFRLDIVRRPMVGNDVGVPLEGVFHLYKLHGSVNWSQRDRGRITITPMPAPETALLIYPADGKYQQSYVQPHLEMMSQYLSALREPNTCVVVIGFGFADNHLSEPILGAVKTNPHMRLIVVNPFSQERMADNKDDVWREMLSLANAGDDVWFINATFAQFAEMIPNLRALSPPERLSEEIMRVTRQGNRRE